MTNYEKIKNMTLDEIETIICKSHIGIYCDDCCSFHQGTECKIHEWLESETEE